MILILDYGVGNLLSIQRAFKFFDIEIKISNSSKDINNSSHLVLPGVGAFRKAMEALHNLKLVNTIIKAANQGVPLLGICLGMQLLLDESDEFGLTKGLGLIPGRIEKFPTGKNDNIPIKIPQINWHELVPSTSKKSWKNSLLNNQKPNDAVYFVHSFVAKPSNNNHILADYICSGNRISAVIVKDNIIGCQFHPEKSGKVGLEILQNFMLL